VLPRAFALPHPRAFALLHSRALPLLLLCCLAAFGSKTAHAQSAKTWDKRGQVAESHKDYDTAFQDFQHAVNLKPNDLRYKESLARMRFQAAAAHVDRGRVLTQSGDLNGALAEFQRAKQIWQKLGALWKLPRPAPGDLETDDYDPSGSVSEWLARGKRKKPKR